MKSLFDGQDILITGGTGSFGKQFTRTVLANCKPKRLIIYSRDEFKQFEMAQEFPEDKYPCMRYFIGDVRDQQRLERAFDGVDYVIHAAAIKHVSIAEYNPFECVKTNIHGAENVVNAAINQRVKKIVALSTDKACNPINLYGATKLASDKIFIAANNYAGTSRCRFSVVRYGNVVGSRGSVVPFFSKLIAEGADFLPITDDRMTRFWITVQAGVDFVTDSFKMMNGGEIFVPKIPSMGIMDITRIMAPNMKTKVIGIRPGEKLHEEMISEADAMNTYELEDRYVIKSQSIFRTEKENPNKQPGKLVENDFHYASDSNSEWVTDDQFKEMLEK